MSTRPVLPVWMPPGGFGFLDGFKERRDDQSLAEPDARPFGMDAATLGGDVTQKVVRIVAEDGGHARAILYTLGGERTAVFMIHPRADVSSHYLVPALLDAGYAVFAEQSRYFNNDEDCLHEAVLGDIAAGIRILRSAGYERVVLLGNSGGGSLLTFYQATAQTPPPGRPTHTPGGTPYDLNGFDLPTADGLLLLAAHMGEGKYLMNVIDPSVTNEADPLSCDPALDMYNPANGFRRPPESSRYSAAFVNEYRAAQRARVARLDAIAHQHIEENRQFADLVDEDWFRALPLSEQISFERRSVVGKYLMIARTDADPAGCDLSLQPSQRSVGSLLGPRPDLQNYERGHFARCMTPEGWLSTWSGLSSRASLIDTVAHVTVPTYVINYAADPALYPADAEAVYKESAAADKLRLQIEGDHYGVGGSGKAKATTAILAWLRERFPVR
jgi:hypothetical protein